MKKSDLRDGMKVIDTDDGMIMEYKKVFNLNISITGFNCSLTPVIFFRISLAKGFRIQITDFLQHIFIHPHTEANTCWHCRIWWFDLFEAGVNFIHAQSEEQ